MKASVDVLRHTYQIWLPSEMAGCLAAPEAVIVRSTFFKICFGVLWTLMNLLLLHAKLSFTSPEKHCKINQILPKAASIFGQLNSKSVLSQRSINLPNRRSHSSRTKTHSYAYIKQTGPGLVSACILRRVVAPPALTVRSPWWLLARQRLLPVSLSSVAHKSDPGRDGFML